MSTETVQRTEAPTTTGHAVHHHAVRLSLRLYLQLRDGGLPLPAKCGSDRKAHPNPLELPCCPQCAALLSSPCGGGGS